MNRYEQLEKCRQMGRNDARMGYFPMTHLYTREDFARAYDQAYWETMKGAQQYGERRHALRRFTDV